MDLLNFAIGGNISCSEVHGLNANTQQILTNTYDTAVTEERQGVAQDHVFARNAYASPKARYRFLRTPKDT